LRVVTPDNPLVDIQPQVHCFRAALTEGEVNVVRAELDAFCDQVSQWSGGLIELQPRIHQPAEAAVTLSPSGDSLWLTPSDMETTARALLTNAPDFVMVIHGLRDPDSGLSFKAPGCDMPYRVGDGLLGAGYSWISPACAKADFFTHQWLVQLHGGLQELSNLDDPYYEAGYAPCGQGAQDVKSWFPHPDGCSEDPDYDLCGLECGYVPRWYFHLLSVHWNPSWNLISNHCKDGAQDFGEFDVDTGVDCL
jgi:hypothetical protein